MEDEIKPWLHRPPSFSAEIIQTPLDVVCRSFTERLKSDLKEQPADRLEYWRILWGLTQSAVGCYAAVCILLSRKEPKIRLAAQAQVLNRTLVEALANLVLLGEDPPIMSRIFAKHGYRFLAMRHEHLKGLYGTEQEVRRSYFEASEKTLALRAGYLGLSQDEIADPENNIKERWPRLDGMVRGRMTKGGRPWLSGSRQGFLEYVNTHWYGQMSDAVHQLETGVNAALLQSNPEHQWNPGLFESEMAIDSMLFLTCVLSEVESLTSYGAKQRLREIWTNLRKAHADDVDVCLSLRYDELLRENVSDPGDGSSSTISGDDPTGE